MRIKLASLVTLLFFQGTVFADLINSKTDLQCYDYLVSAVYETDDLAEHTLNGTMTIKQSEIREESHTVYFENEISNYSISIDDTDPKVGEGHISTIWYEYSDGSFTCGFDVFSLWGDFPLDMVSFDVNFYDQDKNLYSKYGPPTDYYNLPYYMELSDRHEHSQGLYIKSMQFERVCSVPECSSFEFFLCGVLICLLLSFVVKKAGICQVKTV